MKQRLDSDLQLTFIEHIAHLTSKDYAKVGFSLTHMKTKTHSARACTLNLLEVAYAHTVCVCARVRARLRECVFDRPHLISMANTGLCMRTCASCVRRASERASKCICGVCEDGCECADQARVFRGVRLLARVHSVSPFSAGP